MTAELTDFENIQTDIQDLYQNGEFASAFDLVMQARNDFPEHRPILEYWGMNLAARIGKIADTINIFKGALENGFWYAEPLLRESTSLEHLKGNQEYEKLIEYNNQLKEEDPTTKFPILTIRPEGQCLSNESACPLLIVFHANASNAQAALELWRETASNGWLLSAPQSSQALWKGAFVWDDFSTAELEISHHLRSIFSKYSISDNQVVTAGISMGAELAIRLSLKQSIPATGFLAINPTGPSLDELNKMLANNDFLDCDLRGYFLNGDYDTSLNYEDIKMLMDKLNESGITCRSSTFPLQKFESHHEYDETILRCLKFVSP